jgi:hypothetical protein
MGSHDKRQASWPRWRKHCVMKEAGLPEKAATEW